MERYDTLDNLHKELKAKERVEELYAGKEGEGDAAAAVVADGGAEEDDAKIQDEEDAGGSERLGERLVHRVEQPAYPCLSSLATMLVTQSIDT